MEVCRRFLLRHRSFFSRYKEENRSISRKLSAFDGQKEIKKGSCIYSVRKEK